MAKGFNTFTQNGKDWEEGVNYERLRRERLQRTRDAMKKNGFDAIIAHRAENIRYITGVRSQMQRPGRENYYTVVPIEGDPWHFELGGDLGRVKENAPWMGERLGPACPLGDEGPAAGELAARKNVDVYFDQISETLKKMGVEKGRIGIDTITLQMYEKFKKEGLNVADGRKTMFDARMVKTQDEQQLCFITSTVADACFQTIMDYAHPGVAECEVWGQVMNTAFRLGAELAGGILTTGGRTNPYYRLPASDKIMAPGDLLVSDVVINVMGYYSCEVRTFLIGDKAATKEQKAAHKTAYDALYRSIDACQAGVTTDKVAAQFIQEGFETYSLQIGHGLGQSVQEAPMIHPVYSKHPHVLEPGTYIALETFAPVADGSQGVRLEEDLLVTEDGPMVFSRYPFDPKLMG